MENVCKDGRFNMFGEMHSCRDMAEAVTELTSLACAEAPPVMCKEMEILKKLGFSVGSSTADK